MRKVLILLVTVVFVSCGPTKETSKNYDIPEKLNEEIPEPENYRASFRRSHDLLHSDVSIRFDWEKQHGLGTAKLTLRPYFYVSNQLSLNAKGMDIHKVSLSVEDSLQALPYIYRNDTIFIQLDKTMIATRSSL